MSKQPTAPQMRVLIAATSNGGRLPLNCLAYAGVYAPYAGLHSPASDLIRAVLAKAAKARSARRAETILCDELDFDQILLAGGFLDIERNSFRDGKGDLAERYAKALYSGHGRIEGVTSLNVRACIRAGWLDERWNLTTEGGDAAFAVDPDGYADALPADQCAAEMIRADEALIAAGRVELCTARTNPAYPHTYEHDSAVSADTTTRPGHDTCGRSVLQHAEYTPERILHANWREACYHRAAVNAVHADIPMNMSIAAQQLLDEAHAEALADGGNLPAGFVGYDISTRRAEAYLGYFIWVGTELEILAHVESTRGGEAARLHIPDGHGSVKCVGTAYSHFTVYGPAGGGPNRHHFARQAVTTAADRAVLVVDEAHQVVDEWNTAVPDRSGKAGAVLDDIIRSSRDPNVIMHVIDVKNTRSGWAQQYPTIQAMIAADGPLPETVWAKGEMVMQGAIGGTTGRGKTLPPWPVSDPTEVAAAMAGVQIATLDPGSRDALFNGITPDQAGRLFAGTHPDLADELRPAAEHTRDAILAAIVVAVLTADPDATTTQALDGDPTLPGYRLRLHLTRTKRGHEYPEAVRVALFHFELGLTRAANNSRGAALTGLRKAAARLGVAPYTA